MSDLIAAPLMAKLLSGIGGLVGGASFMAFYRPKNVWDAAIRSGLSVTAAIVFSPVIIEWFQFSHNMDIILASSVVIGFCAWSILSFTAKLLIDIQDEKVKINIPGIIDRK